MPAPGQVTYADAVKVSAQTEVLTAIDAGTGAGKIRLYTSGDALLGEIVLDDPAGTVSGVGQLTLTAPGGDTATADGTCAWASITDSDNTVVVSMDASQGTSPVSGEIVISSLSIVNGADLTLVSATIG